MINMDTRGQLSAEYILILGALLVIILVVGYFASNETEQNTVVSAARLGATNTSAELGVLNRSSPPIRVTNIDMTGNTNISIIIHISNLPADQKQNILIGVQKSIEASGFTVTNTGNNLTIDTTKHNYLITIAN